MAELVLVVGGSSSGKSRLAEKMAAEKASLTRLPVYYIATGMIYDEEFAGRIERHRLRRPAHWETIEEPCEIHRVFNEHCDKPGIYLLDGLGTWISNLMYRQSSTPFIWSAVDEQIICEHLAALIEALSRMRGTVIAVADETGMGLVPSSYESRVFRDLNGMVNQKLAEQADAVYLVTCGIPLEIKNESGRKNC